MIKKMPILLLALVLVGATNVQATGFKTESYTYTITQKHNGTIGYHIHNKGKLLIHQYTIIIEETKKIKGYTTIIFYQPN